MLQFRFARMTRHLTSRCIVGLLLCATLVLQFGCGAADDDGPTLTVYVSADEYVAREIIATFTEQTGIDVNLVGDTEAKKTTGLVERLRREADQPQADVFWSSEVFLTIALADEGVLAPFEPSNAVDWPTAFRDDEHRWYGLGARARVIAFDPSRLPEADRPKTWMDLTNPKWKGRIAMADPRFGTTGGHLGAMKVFWDQHISPAAFEAFSIGIAENEPQVLASGNAGSVQAVIYGEADLALTDTDDVWAAKANGASIDLVYPAHSMDMTRIGHGTLLIPNTVALVNGAPQPELAAQFIEFMLSEAVERQLAATDSHNVPIRPDLDKEFPEYEIPNPLRVNFARAAAARDDAIRIFLDAVNNQQNPQPNPGRPDVEAPDDDPPHPADRDDDDAS